MPGKFDRVKPGQPFGIVGRGGALTLDAPAAKFMNSLLAELRRLGKWSAAAPLALRDGPEGRSLSLNLPRTIMGTLSGASSPYDLTEQLGASGGTWTSSGGGVSCSACAYEANSRAGLSGKTVELVNVGKGDWRFYWVTGATCASLVFHVKSCGSSGPAIPGVTITVKDGGGNTVDTGTTDSSGNYTTASLPCASYTWTATLTGWVSDSGSATITTAGVNVTVNSSAMRPNTIHLTDANTTIALIYDSTNGIWRGCYTLSATGVTSVPGTPPCVTCGNTPVTTVISYVLNCTSGTTYQLAQVLCVDNCADTGCACAGGCTQGWGSGTCQANGTPICHGFSEANLKTRSGTINPFSLSYSFSVSIGFQCPPGVNCCTCVTLNGLANGTVTLSL